MLSQLPYDSAQRICHNMANSLIDFSTLCSGTDAAVATLQMLQQALLSTFKVAISLKYVFGCEIKEWKRSFALRSARPEHFYEDVVLMGQECALDTLSGMMTPITRTSLCIAGFECDSVSAANSRRSDFKQCCPQTTGKTGQTWGGLCLFIKLKVVVAEKVKALGQVAALVPQEGHQSSATRRLMLLRTTWPYAFGA